MTLPSYAVDFRGFPACPCQATWLPVFERELQRQRVITGPLTIAQLIGGAAASGGTHASGGASDFWLLGTTADAGVRVARQMGADATWHRPHNWDGQGGSEHVHSVLRDCPHNGPAAYQINAVDHGFNGLGHLGLGAPDDGPRPLSERTWQEGFKWAQQQEALMVTPEDEKKIADIVRAVVREEIDATTVPNPGDPKGKPWKLPRLLVDTWKRAGS